MLRGLAARLIDHRLGLLDVSVASYNHLAQVELPQMVNELRPITWLERRPDGGSLSIVLNIRFSRMERPQLTDHQIMLPLQAQQLSKSYNGRLLIDVEVAIKTTNAATGETYENQADVRDLCVGEIPVLVGSCLCHRPLGGGSAPSGGGLSASYFVVKGQTKVIVSRPDRPSARSIGRTDRQ